MKKFESVLARIVNYIGNDKWTASLSSNALWYYIEFRYNGEPSMIGGYSFRPKCDKEIMSKEFLDTWFVSEDETRKIFSTMSVRPRRHRLGPSDKNTGSQVSAFIRLSQGTCPGSGEWSRGSLELKMRRRFGENKWNVT